MKLLITSIEKYRLEITLALIYSFLAGMTILIF